MSLIDFHLLACSGLLSCLNFLCFCCSFFFSILFSMRYFSAVQHFRHFVLSPPAFLLTGCAEQMVGGTQCLFGVMLSPEEALVPGLGSTRDLHMAQRTCRMEEGKGHFIQIWGLLGTGSSRRLNPHRIKRVAQPRDQSCVQMPAGAHPWKQEVSQDCGGTLCVTVVQKTASHRCSPPTNKELLGEAHSTTWS